MNADILVMMRERTPRTARLTGRLPHLKLLVASGMCNAAIDLHACAEHQSLRNHGPWQHTSGIGLHSKTLGLVVGLGKIGGEIAKVAQAFGIRVCAWSQNLTPTRAAECGAQRMPSLLRYSMPVISSRSIWY